jgi:hypothetical protein
VPGEAEGQVELADDVLTGHPQPPGVGAAAALFVVLCVNEIVGLFE